MSDCMKKSKEPKSTPEQSQKYSALFSMLILSSADVGQIQLTRIPSVSNTLGPDQTQNFVVPDLQPMALLTLSI